MKIDMTQIDPIEIVTEKGNKYRLFRNAELHPRTRKPEYKNAVYLESQEIYGDILNTVEHFEQSKYVKPKDEERTFQLWRSRESKKLVQCVFLDDCIALTEEEKRQKLIPRGEYKTRYQWKIFGREVNAGANPVHKTWTIDDKEVEADYYHISDTTDGILRSKTEWHGKFRRGIKEGAPFVEKEWNNGEKLIKAKFYHKEDTYDLYNIQECDKYGGDLREEKQWKDAGRVIKENAPFEEKLMEVYGKKKAYKYYHRKDTEPMSAEELEKLKKQKEWDSKDAQIIREISEKEEAYQRRIFEQRDGVI